MCLTHLENQPKGELTVSYNLELAANPLVHRPKFLVAKGFSIVSVKIDIEMCRTWSFIQLFFNYFLKVNQMDMLIIEGQTLFNIAHSHFVSLYTHIPLATHRENCTEE